ncbi:MCE family protein [Nocardia sp. BMG111209]|uniref:MCE family protein n=1 Tax=Nocardia sp. BMG111209 TaxID=1160137 RepID=UPI000374D0BA|nr:MCE family protein [Nocardia sp. BMG111209]
MTLRITALRAVLLALTALVAGSCSLVPGSVRDAVGGTTHITADFRNIAGMFEGNPVTVLGLEVGKVDKIIPQGEFVEVHISLDSDVKLPKNVTAALISPSIVTDRHIELSPRYTGGPALPDNSHLTVEQTRTPVELDTLLQTIDQFAAALKPQPGQEGIGPLSGRVLYPMLNGNGEKMRDTLNALSGALKVGVDNKDAISTIIVKLNDLTTMLAENDRSVRDFSDRTTQLTRLLADQAPGLQATLKQLSAFLANTSGTLSAHQEQLADTLNKLTTVTRQLRDNAVGITEVVDVTPMLFQNMDRAMNREQGYVRLHALLGTALSGEVVSLFCERIQMKADGCRTGRIEDFGPDFGISAALLEMTK